MMNKQLQKIAYSDDFSPKELLYFLSADVDKRFRADAGVWEKYSIYEHTLMVMEQFERYFGCGQLSDVVDCGVFRMMLALHDIGKPDAIALGDKNMQHKYTIKIMQRLFAKYNIAQQQTKIMCALVNTDVLGNYIRGRISCGKAAKQLQQDAQSIQLPVKDFFDVLSIYYRCDAGSYTEDAGGFKSLDHLFVFDRNAPSLTFAPDVLSEVQKLEESINSK